MKKLYHPKTGSWFKKVNRNLIWDFYGKTDAIFLTFDDGPTPGVTDTILDILKKYKAVATFFCKGMNVEQNQKIYNRILEEGHAVGNHSYSHPKGWYTKNRVYFNDIALARNFIDSDLFRPPHGKITFLQSRQIRKTYKIIMWDIMSFDFDKDTSVKECTDNVLNHVRPGSIIAFHDSEKASEKVIHSLPMVLNGLIKKHYVFNQRIGDLFIE